MGNEGKAGIYWGICKFLPCPQETMGLGRQTEPNDLLAAKEPKDRKRNSREEQKAGSRRAATADDSVAADVNRL